MNIHNFREKVNRFSSNYLLVAFEEFPKYSSKWTSQEFSFEDLEEGNLGEGLSKDDADILKARINEVLSAIEKTGPPELVHSLKSIVYSVKFYLTNSPEKLGKDQKTNLPYIASCNPSTIDDRLSTIDDRLSTIDDRPSTIDDRFPTIYLHVIDFFNQPSAKQIEILYHELISHLTKGITNEEEAMRDTRDWITSVSYTHLTLPTIYSV